MSTRQARAVSARLGWDGNGPATLAAAAQPGGYSRERVRQLEADARERGARADQIPESLPGVGYVRLDGVREPARVRASYVTDADIASSNLILWGDPVSNRILARIADKLPIRWDSQGIRVGLQQHVRIGF